MTLIRPLHVTMSMGSQDVLHMVSVLSYSTVVLMVYIGVIEDAVLMPDSFRQKV